MSQGSVASMTSQVVLSCRQPLSPLSLHYLPELSQVLPTLTYFTTYVCLLFKSPFSAASPVCIPTTPFLMLLGLLYNSPIWGLCLLESDLGRCTCFWNGQLLKRYWTVESCVKGETTALERGPPPTLYLLWAATELREEPQCELVLFGAFNHFSSWPHVSTVISWGDTLLPLALPFMKIRVLVMTTIVIMSAEPHGQQVWASTLVGMCTRVWASTLMGMCTRVNQRKGTWA